VGRRFVRMRTTLKRGVGRGAGVNGSGGSVFPPGPVSAVSRYRQPPPAVRTGLGLFRRILFVAVLSVVALALGIGGGAYLWFHESLNAVRAHSAAVKIAQKELNVQLPGQAAVALILGYDQRAGKEFSTVSRSDTLMLVRADPRTRTISLFSFPRDLNVPIWCDHRQTGVGKINSAYASCGPKGSLETVKQLTGIPINYLITVNFHGFKEIVDQFGGVYMDVDRRYYNPAGSGYAAIDIQPGYQLLTGGAALDFVRFRHTDSDLYRLARQQEFVRAFKEQIAQHFNPFNLPKIVSSITKNIEVGGNFSGGTVYQYAQLAATLPSGHFLQIRIDPSQISGSNDLTTSAQTIQAAVNQFVNPDVGVAKVANATALGTKLKTKTPAPGRTTVTVLNGNGIPGAAVNASYLLGQRGYVLTLPPGGAQPNAPAQNYFHTAIYFDPAAAAAKAAAQALATLLAPADVLRLPARGQLRALDPGSMLLVVLGTSFQNGLTSPPPPAGPVRQLPAVRADSSSGTALLGPFQHRVPFPLETPTVLEQNSYPDTQGGDTAARLYWIETHHKAVRLVFRTGGNQYWGIEETNWAAPALADKSFQHTLGGRHYDLFYSGAHLHMAVLRTPNATYWVVNTLLDSLSNETMIAIAQGLKPLTAAK
jgi:LCP family protein required for cell wall assembly